MSAPPSRRMPALARLAVWTSVACGSEVFAAVVLVRALDVLCGGHHA